MVLLTLLWPDFLYDVSPSPKIFQHLSWTNIVILIFFLIIILITVSIVLLGFGSFCYWHICRLLFIIIFVSITFIILCLSWCRLCLNSNSCLCLFCFRDFLLFNWWLLLFIVVLVFLLISFQLLRFLDVTQIFLII